MATKRILKFALKMAIAGLILAGIIFVIVRATTPKKEKYEIVNASNSYEITTKYSQTYDNMLQYAPSATLKYVRIMYTNRINAVLLENYNYYINLTLFENYSNSSLKAQIKTQLKKLAGQIDKTLEMARLTKVEGLQNDERQRRLTNYVADYFEQTKTFIELNDMLKDYVYKVSYGSVTTGNVYETQLEMIRNYAKVAFNHDIYGKYESVGNDTILSDTSSTSFQKVLQKYNDRQTQNTNGDKEVKFTETYMNLSDDVLYEFYSQTTNKQEYVNSMEKGTTKNNLIYLFDYISQENF